MKIKRSDKTIGARAGDTTTGDDGNTYKIKHMKDGFVVCQRAEDGAILTVDERSLTLVAREFHPEDPIQQKDEHGEWHDVSRDDPDYLRLITGEAMVEIRHANPDWR